MKDKLFDNLIGIQKEMLKILGEVNSLTLHPNTVEEAIDDVWHPKCDVFQTDDAWIIIVELAGVKKEDITISTADSYIRITGERGLATPNCQMCYYNLEIETGKFEKCIYYPAAPIDKENPKVTYEDGFLRLVFPLRQVVERIIEIA